MKRTKVPPPKDEGRTPPPGRKLPSTSSDKNKGTRLGKPTPINSTSKYGAWANGPSTSSSTAATSTSKKMAQLEAAYGSGSAAYGMLVQQHSTQVKAPTAPAAAGLPPSKVLLKKTTGGGIVQTSKAAYAKKYAALAGGEPNNSNKGVVGGKNKGPLLSSVPQQKSSSSKAAVDLKDDDQRRKFKEIEAKNKGPLLSSVQQKSSRSSKAAVDLKDDQRRKLKEIEAKNKGPLLSSVQQKSSSKAAVGLNKDDQKRKFDKIEAKLVESTQGYEHQFSEPSSYSPDFEEEYPSDFEDDGGSELEPGELEPGEVPPFLLRKLSLRNTTTPSPVDESSSYPLSEGEDAPWMDEATRTKLRRHYKELEEAAKKKSILVQKPLASAAPSKPLVFSSPTAVVAKPKIDKSPSVQIQKISPISFEGIKRGDDGGTGTIKPSVHSLVKRSVMMDFEGATQNVAKDGKFQRSISLKEMVELHSTSSASLFHLNSSQEKFRSAKNGLLYAHQGIQMENPKCSQGSQTEKVQMTSKWTQRPPAWTTNRTEKDIRSLRQEALGVGSDFDALQHQIKCANDEEDFDGDFPKSWELEVGSSWSKIASFIARSSKKMLYVLESQKRFALGSHSETKFSRGLAVFNALEMGFLCCEGDLLACANFYPPEKSLRKNEAKTIVTVWSLKEPSCPKYFLRMWGKVTAINIFNYGHIVVAAGKDGGIAIWDLDENTHYHKLYQDRAIRTPTIDTAMIDVSHKDVVIGVTVLTESEAVYKMVSMDQSGVFKLWTLTRFEDYAPDPRDNSRNTAYWSKLNLVHKMSIRLNDTLREEHFLVKSFRVWPSDPEGGGSSLTFAFGTVNGYVVQGLWEGDSSSSTRSPMSNSPSRHMNGVNGGGDSDPAVLEDAEGVLEAGSGCTLQIYYQKGYKRWVTALGYSSALNLVGAGCSDGKCRIYSFSKHALLGVLEVEACPIRVCFSQKRPSVIYVAVEGGLVIFDLVVSSSRAWKKVSVGGIVDFSLYSSMQNEFTVTTTLQEIKVSQLVGDLPPLKVKEQKKLDQFRRKFS